MPKPRRATLQTFFSWRTTAGSGPETTAALPEPSFRAAFKEFDFKTDMAITPAPPPLTLGLLRPTCSRLRRVGEWDPAVLRKFGRRR